MVYGPKCAISSVFWEVKVPRCRDSKIIYKTFKVAKSGHPPLASYLDNTQQGHFGDRQLDVQTQNKAKLKVHRRKSAHDMHIVGNGPVQYHRKIAKAYASRLCFHLSAFCAERCQVGCHCICVVFALRSMVVHGSRRCRVFAKMRNCCDQWCANHERAGKFASAGEPRIECQAARQTQTRAAVWTLTRLRRS